MTARSLFDFLRRRARELRHADAANVTLTFALAIVPVIGLVGAAVDYSRAAAIRTAMQSAVDSTALMLSKITTTDVDLQEKACQYFYALRATPDYVCPSPQITATYTTEGGSQIVVKAADVVKTDFMGILGISKIDVDVESQVKWGNTRLRVALVLDNTGSMNDDGKMDALKTATKGMLDQLKNAASKDGDIYISVIPFVKDVNVGSSNSNADWIYWDSADNTDNKSWDANNGTCSPQSSYKNRNSCVSQGVCSISGNNNQNSCTSAGTCSISGYNSKNSCTSAGTCSISGNNSKSNCQADSACSLSKYSTQSKCTKNGGTWASGVWTTGVWTTGVWTQNTWTPNNHSTWNGCVVDRGNPSGPSSDNYDTNVTQPSSGVSASLFAAEQFSSCPQAVLPLGYDWDGMNAMVDNMSPAGNTNQAIGLAHGWMSLVGGGPYPDPPAMDPNYKYQQVIILMTDGLNTQNRWTSSTSSIDARQKITCDNVNAANITLYAIQVNTGGDPTSTLLQGCAGTAPLPDGTPRKYPDPSKFFLLTSADQLVTTFQRIGTQLSNLRIAQ